MSRRYIESLYRDELSISAASEIDIEAIAYYKGAMVKVRPLRGCEARIIGYGDRAVISVNSASMTERRRFSIGHELGHWIKHRGTVGNLCKKELITANRTSNSRNLLGREKIANEYASELLMPEYLFARFIRGADISFDVIQSIKEAFGVSLTAAAIRFVNSCDYPVILACYGPNGRRWYHKSKQVPQYFYPVRVISHESPGFCRILSNNEKYEAHEVDSDIWIDALGAEKYEVMEVIWPISRDSFMVFLWWADESQIVDQIEEEEKVDIVEPTFR
ncbi:ImmA/IrrE family metallo-endopeptidase [Haliea salexigens]|uniref:ImmA/IrrE family metallo-endopeptidase n=1 Tax=Haliea salexigens TaxID=287487 RepID=UPI000A0216F7|nr:ImmA/IrrE family metallo-endopeptidase [Haliea salexigens]